jgi:hypothetical protein
MSSDPQAWWDHEPVMKEESVKVVEAPIEEKPKEKRMSTLQKRTSQLFGLVGSDKASENEENIQNSVTNNGSVMLLYSGWLKKRG